MAKLVPHPSVPTTMSMSSMSQLPESGIKSTAENAHQTRGSSESSGLQKYVVHRSPAELNHLAKANMVAYILTVQRWSFHFQRFRGSLGHVRDDGGAQPTPKRCHIQESQKMNHKLNRMENHKHPEQTSFEKTCKIFSQKMLCCEHIVVKSQLGGTLFHAPTHECPIHIRNDAGRFSFYQNFRELRKLLAIMAAWPKN